jgi:hypothetical protein
MRCVCCNKMLSDYEATLKHGETGEYLDTCSGCLSEIMADTALHVVDNPSLLRKDNIDEDFDDEGVDKVDQ